MEDKIYYNDEWNTEDKDYNEKMEKLRLEQIRLMQETIDRILKKY